jgi:hypothetical protein
MYRFQLQGIGVAGFDVIHKAAVIDLEEFIPEGRTMFRDWFNQEKVTKAYETYFVNMANKLCTDFYEEIRNPSIDGLGWIFSVSHKLSTLHRSIDQDNMLGFCDSAGFKVKHEGSGMDA